MLAPNGKIYMVPYKADSVGVLDPSYGSFTVIDISSVISTDGKYYEGVLAEWQDLHGASICRQCRRPHPRQQRPRLHRPAPATAGFAQTVTFMGSPGSSLGQARTRPRWSFDRQLRSRQQRCSRWHQYGD